MIRRAFSSLPRRTALAFALVAALLLPSCIDAEQDIWLNEDGSGRVKLKLGISKQMLQMMGGLGGDEANDDPFEIDKMRNELTEDSNVDSFEITEEEDDKFKYVIVNVELADITRLSEMQDSMMADGPAAGAGGTDGDDLKITRNESGTYQIVGKIEAPSEEEANLGPMAGMLKGMIGDAAITVRVHAEPVSDDAHNGTVDEDGSVVWSLPLSEMLGGKGMDFEGEFLASGGGGSGSGGTFWLVLASVLILAAVLFFVFRAQKPKLA